jgi:hypothetical protein
MSILLLDTLLYSIWIRWGHSTHWSNNGGGTASRRTEDLCTVLHCASPLDDRASGFLTVGASIGLDFWVRVTWKRTLPIQDAHRARVIEKEPLFYVIAVLSVCSTAYPGLILTKVGRIRLWLWWKEGYHWVRTSHKFTSIRSPSAMVQAAAEERVTPKTLSTFINHHVQGRGPRDRQKRKVCIPARTQNQGWPTPMSQCSKRLKEKEANVAIISTSKNLVKSFFLSYWSCFMCPYGNFSFITKHKLLNY